MSEQRNTYAHRIYNKLFARSNTVIYLQLTYICIFYDFSNYIVNSSIIFNTFLRNPDNYALKTVPVQKCMYRKSIAFEWQIFERAIFTSFIQKLLFHQEYIYSLYVYICVCVYVYIHIFIMNIMKWNPNRNLFYLILNILCHFLSYYIRIFHIYMYFCTFKFLIYIFTFVYDINFNKILLQNREWVKL